MANLCDFMMKIKGKTENVYELIRLMKADLNNHNEQTGKKKRIECVDVLSMENVNGTYVATIDGNCSWSVYTSMLEEGIHTTIPVESKRLNIDVEIYSAGTGFMEHYIIKNGVLESSKCVDYEEYCIEGYNTKEEAEEDLDIHFTDKEWANANHDEGYIACGGMEWHFAI